MILLLINLLYQFHNNISLGLVFTIYFRWCYFHFFHSIPKYHVNKGPVIIMFPLFLVSLYMYGSLYVFMILFYRKDSGALTMTPLISYGCTLI